jgi:hypothetical protein
LLKHHGLGQLAVHLHDPAEKAAYLLHAPPKEVEHLDPPPALAGRLAASTEHLHDPPGKLGIFIPHLHWLDILIHHLHWPDPLLHHLNRPLLIHQGKLVMVDILTH